jgi:hypothetical protein
MITIFGQISRILFRFGERSIWGRESLYPLREKAADAFSSRQRNADAQGCAISLGDGSAKAPAFPS